MEPISDEQKLEFANSSFPGKTVNLGNGDWWFIQAGNILGDNLHYEYWDGQVSLHIEGPNWRPLRNYYGEKYQILELYQKSGGVKVAAGHYKQPPLHGRRFKKLFWNLIA